MATPYWSMHETMLQRVASSLGPELVREVAFVGGCTVGLLVTDPLVREAVRYTQDVDAIVHVLGRGQWYQLERKLATRGFRHSQDDTEICRRRLRDGFDGELIVDFMPDDAAILGFSNRWYAVALRDAQDHALPSGDVIRVVTPAHFLGTKIEAWRGRGNNDPLSSRDVEDILNVVEGRNTLTAEVTQASMELRQDIATGLRELLAHTDFDYAVQSATRGNQQRTHLLFQRLDALTTVNIPA